LTLAQSLAKERTDPLDVMSINSGIVNPFDLIIGDTVEVCGSAYISNRNADTFGATLGWFDCTEDISSSGQFTITVITSDTFTVIDGRVCWALGFGVAANSVYTSCNTHFVLGFNTDNGSADHTVTFSWNLHVDRSCST